MCSGERLSDSPSEKKGKVYVFCKAVLTSDLVQRDIGLFVVAVPKSLG